MLGINFNLCVRRPLIAKIAKQKIVFFGKCESDLTHNSFAGVLLFKMRFWYVKSVSLNVSQGRESALLTLCLKLQVKLS